MDEGNNKEAYVISHHKQNKMGMGMIKPTITNKSQQKASAEYERNQCLALINYFCK
jgi:hypothetical protein